MLTSSERAGMPTGMRQTNPSTPQTQDKVRELDGFFRERGDMPPSAEECAKILENARRFLKGFLAVSAEDVLAGWHAFLAERRAVPLHRAKNTHGRHEAFSALEDADDPLPEAEAPAPAPARTAVPPPRMSMPARYASWLSVQAYHRIMLGRPDRPADYPQRAREISERFRREEKNYKVTASLVEELWSREA